MSAEASPCADTQPLRETSEIFQSVREPGRTPTHRARRIRPWLTLLGSSFRSAPLLALEVQGSKNQVFEIVQKVVWTSDVGHEHLLGMQDETPHRPLPAFEAPQPRKTSLAARLGL